MLKLLSILVSLCIATLSLNAKTLVVYYSYTNNVEKIINNLRAQIECDVVEIEPAEKGLDYEANNYAIGSAQIAAIRSNPSDPSSYPAIDPVTANLDEYDTIIIGAPLWWSQMAAPLQTYLFQNGAKMAGKKIGLIVSSHSSGISGVVSDAHRLIPEGDFLEPALWIRSSEVSNSPTLLSTWLDQIHYKDISTGLFSLTYGQIESVSLFSLNGMKIADRDKTELSEMPVGLYIVKEHNAVPRKILIK